jgi:hypothetical protein
LTRDGVLLDPLTTIRIIIQGNLAPIQPFRNLYGCLFPRLRFLGPVIERSPADAALAHELGYEGFAELDASGFFAYHAATLALQEELARLDATASLGRRTRHPPLRRPLDGVLFMHDDVFLWPFEPTRFNWSRPMLSRNWPGPPAPLPSGPIAFVNLSDPRTHLNQVSLEFGAERMRAYALAAPLRTGWPAAACRAAETWVYNEADFFYVPMSRARQFVEAAVLMHAHRIWLEVALPTLVLCHLGADDVLWLPLKTEWEPSRRSNASLMLSVFGDDFLLAHPVKLSSTATCELVRAVLDGGD